MYAKNKDLLNHTRKTNFNGVNYVEINTEIHKLKNRVKSNPNPDKKVKEAIQNDVNMITYLIEHPNRSNFKSKTVNNLIERVERIVNDVAGIDTSSLSEHKIGTLTVG